MQDDRVPFELMRGKRLCGIEPRITPSGQYEHGNSEFRERGTIDPATVATLARETARLNAESGDPTKPPRYRI